MKNTIKGLWYIIISTMVLTMFVLVSMSWGHSVNDSLDNYSWKDYDCEHRMHDDYDIHHNHTTSSDEDGNPILGDAIGIWHWHKHATTDNGDLLESYKDKHKGDLSVSHSADAWTSTGCSDEEEYDVEPSDSGNNPSVPPAEVEVVTPDTPISNPSVQPEVDTVTFTPTTRYSSSIFTSTTSVQKSLEEAQESIPEDVVVPEPPAPIVIPESCAVERVERFFYKGYTLYAPTVLSEDVETLSDLWERNWFTGATEGAFYVYLGDSFVVYRGEGDIGSILLTPSMGIIVEQVTNGTYAGLAGCPVLSPAQIELDVGLNLIGFPTAPDTIERPSDLLSDIIIEVIVSQKGVLKLVARADDPGDEPLTDGQSLIIITTQAVTINLETPTAPIVRRGGTLATSWGSMKQ